MAGGGGLEGRLGEGMIGPIEFAARKLWVSKTRTGILVAVTGSEWLF